jgi:amino acid transporter
LSASQTATFPARLRRVLTLWDLLFYGIIVIQPTAPLGSFGVVATVAQGHVATTILIGMFAMVLTAVSYGRMANAYPNAGSAYTYVGQELHPNRGFLTGWSIALDYMLNPTIATIWCSKAAMNILPLPFPLWAVSFAALFTFLNLRGIRTTARTNALLTVGMIAVLIAFFITAAGYLMRLSGLTGLFSLQPFYDPATFSWERVSMFHLMNFTLLVATIGSSMGAQLGAGRLLYAMGRDNVIPEKFFGYLDPVRNTPRNNLLLTGAVCAIGSLLITYQTGAELLNFGAFIAFMAVNLAAIVRYYVRTESHGLRSTVVNLLPPLLGFLVCLYIWWSLRTPAKIAGIIWMSMGVLYCAWKTDRFRTRLTLVSVPAED